jgi:hypothetical protein
VLLNIHSPLQLTEMNLFSNGRLDDLPRNGRLLRVWMASQWKKVRWHLVGLLVVALPLLAQTPTPPVISGTIPDRTEGVGYSGSVQFQVFATGTQPFTYQWKKNGANISNGGNVWACLEKVDSDSGRLAVLFGGLFFESHR